MRDNSRESLRSPPPKMPCREIFADVVCRNLLPPRALPLRVLAPLLQSRRQAPTREKQTKATRADSACVAGEIHLAPPRAPSTRAEADTQLEVPIQTCLMSPTSVLALQYQNQSV